jgi:hypothetical protein
VRLGLLLVRCAAPRVHVCMGRAGALRCAALAWVQAALSGPARLDWANCMRLHMLCCLVHRCWQWLLQLMSTALMLALQAAERQEPSVLHAEGFGMMRHTPN